jgi:A/G-specific adenine glycosylase
VPAAGSREECNAADGPFSAAVPIRGELHALSAGVDMLRSSAQLAAARRRPAPAPTREIGQRLTAGRIPCHNIAMKQPAAAAIRVFRAKIRAHYRRHGRCMPWRETRDPYRILVSEIMLQQTQVDRVRGKYVEFLAAFPDIATLAAAPFERVIAAWQGLGYNRRAVALHRCARILELEHRGRVPDDTAALVALPGIGVATAASIRAFAFDAPVVFIETNIRRVFIHEFFPGREAVADAELLPLVATALAKRSPREWYYALMDYGAALARQVPNPNRRSKAYTRQSRFEGSDRQIRGAILRALVGAAPLTGSVIARAVVGDCARVLRLLGDLEREGFVQRVGARFKIAGVEGGS